MYLEAGHAAQNVYLHAVSLKMGGVVMGGFKDEDVRKVLNLSEKEQPLYTMPIDSNWDVSLFFLDEGVACFSPCLHAAGEAFHILITHFYGLGCLTGRSLLIMSASVENDLLIPCQRRKFGLELVQGDRSFQLHCFELYFILVCAHK
jgi:hypothetical protein